MGTKEHSSALALLGVLRKSCNMTIHLDGSIRDGKHVMQVRVYYEDTDFSDPPLL
ncbi:MAG: Tol-Pal system-associated acyl-CoA thioesterase [Afipia sp.]|nr:MAG: Tol-Pal system-associated acyl-CoA thioesterase [Afipia sp.]